MLDIATEQYFPAVELFYVMFHGKLHTFRPICPCVQSGWWNFFFL